MRPVVAENADFYLIEVKEFEPERQTKYGPKDHVHVNLVEFKGGTPNDRGRVSIGQGALVDPLKEIVGQATVLRLGTYYSEKYSKDVHVWRDPSAEDIKVATDYVKGLEADADDAPDF